MNHLLTLNHLTNRYLIIRHGQSLANQQGIIVSIPEHGIGAYGLSDLGKQQVQRSLSEHQDLSGISLIISSDFKRTYETAQIAHTLVTSEVPEIIIDTSLRERNFGEFELSSHEHYQAVWDADAINDEHTLYDAESAASVMTRVSLLIRLLEARYSEHTILLVSHGDTLQILQTAFDKQPASSHRCLPPLKTAEVRVLALAS